MRYSYRGKDPSEPSSERHEAPSASESRPRPRVPCCFYFALLKNLSSTFTKIPAKQAFPPSTGPGPTKLRVMELDKVVVPHRRSAEALLKMLMSVGVGHCDGDVMPHAGRPGVWNSCAPETSSRPGPPIPSIEPTPMTRAVSPPPTSNQTVTTLRVLQLPQPGRKPNPREMGTRNNSRAGGRLCREHPIHAPTPLKSPMFYYNRPHGPY